MNYQEPKQNESTNAKIEIEVKKQPTMGEKLKDNLTEFAEDMGEGLRKAGRKVSEVSKKAVEKTKDMVEKMTNKDK